MKNLRSIEFLFLFVIALPFANGRAAVPSSTADAAKPLTYDVVSIRLNKSGSGDVDITTNDHSFTATNVSLKGLLQGAYDIKEDLISGIPGSIDSARFDIEAKIVEPDTEALKNLTGKQRRAMLLPAFVERFHLKAHIETRTLPVYELVVTSGGPKFKASPPDSKRGSAIHQGGRVLSAHDIPMSALAAAMADHVHRTVLDKTGLAGNYDLDLKWSPDNVPDAEAETAPTFFTAVQEELGLRLQPAKGPVDTLVVDHVEMPTDN